MTDVHVFDEIDLEQEEKDEFVDPVQKWLSSSPINSKEKSNNSKIDTNPLQNRPELRMRTPSLVDELLSEIYVRFGSMNESKEMSSTSTRTEKFSDISVSSHCSRASPDSDCLTEYSTTSDANRPRPDEIDARREAQRRSRLADRGVSALRHEKRRLETQVQYCMSQLTRQVKRRDRLRHRREHQHNMVTAILQASSQKRSEDTRIRFSLDPSPGEPGFSQWKDAMKMVARLPDGVPDHFRRKLWLTVSERHLSERGVDWRRAERFCFNEWTNPDDDELGLQIVRDLHRTGCSLFCGADASQYQLMLKRVLLGYARWNKSIGYCQGFNMLGATILEVMEGCESEALKVMIFMIESVLPEAYFANNLRGLSIDIAVFREVLKSKLPLLSNHLDKLQNECQDKNYEPPLTNVFIMQWFLTLFATCLPRQAVLRVWDLILLEGNEVLIRTALAIWKRLQTRLLAVDTADEFYCVMGQLSQEMMRYSTHDANMLIQELVSIAPFPFTEVYELRERLTYNITPWTQGLAAARRGLRVLYSDEEETNEDDEEDEHIAVAATLGISAVFNRNKLKSSTALTSNTEGPSQLNVDKERLTVDISALRKQYSRLRQRQKQAQIVLSSFNKNLRIKTNTNDIKEQPRMNHLLMGKKPLVNARPRAPPIPGSIPVPLKTSSIKGEGNKGSRSTLYTCPQPEVVLPKLSRSTRSPKSSEQFRQTLSTVTIQPANRMCDVSEESSSSTETCDSSKTLSDTNDSHESNESHQEHRKSDSNLPQERALQIIRENSEILDKIMRKKTQNLNNDLVLNTSSINDTRMNDEMKFRRPSTATSSIFSQNSASQGFNPFPKPVMRQRSRGVASKLGLYAS